MTPMTEQTTEQVTEQPTGSVAELTSAVATNASSDVDLRDRTAALPAPKVYFVRPSQRVQMQRDLEQSGWIVVVVRTLGPASRGQLRGRIEEAIEHALRQRGATPPCVGDSAGLAQVLYDQLQRVEQIGAKGLVVALESLSSLIGATGALGDDDSATVRTVASVTTENHLQFWLSATDEALPAYGPPLPLGALLQPPPSHLPCGLDPVQPRDPSSAQALAPPQFPPPKAKYLAEGKWRQLSQMLDGAQGPKPLATIEKLFVQAYVPLARLVRTGQADSRAAQSLERFSASFEKSYQEAFVAAKATKRRPPMVLDVPQIALRIARLHGARSTALVLVDAMRFDVGLRVETILHEMLRDEAVLAERVVLWAALPAVTTTQLKLLERGPRGLAEPLDTPEMREQEMPILRGRTAATMRRLRLGGLQLYKLDVVQTDVLAPGLAEEQRLDVMAQNVAYPLKRLAATCSARTLMFVFGDHGFVLPKNGAVTGPAVAAGAKPEEVIVPGQAWIIGAVH